jgi:tetratricopeptide (TPR) repeat protein
LNEPAVNKTTTRLSQAWVLLFLILWIPAPALPNPTEARARTPVEEAEPSRETAAREQDDIHSLLFRANQAYLEDRYEEAAGLYERIVERGQLNGHVFFNLGNTYIRLGELGRAILNYRKASLLLPRDGDLKANLQYARSLAKDRIEEASPSLWNTLAFWYFGMNLWELLIALVLLNLLFWSSALFNLYRNSEWAKWSLWLSLLLTLVLGASAGMKATESFRNAGGVLLEDEVPVRAGFSRNDTTLFVLHEGAEFTILDEEQGWWKIALADGKKGWVAAPSGGRVALTRDHPIAR